VGEPFGGGGAGHGVLVEADQLQPGMVLQPQGAVTAPAEGGINQAGRRFPGPWRQGGENLPHLVGETEEMGESIHAPFLSGTGGGSAQDSGPPDRPDPKPSNPGSFRPTSSLHSTYL
jgi:hypothetical protein